jgi:peptide-methionine (R)-S-oxide reductase
MLIKYLRRDPVRPLFFSILALVAAIALAACTAPKQPGGRALDIQKNSPTASTDSTISQGGNLMIYTEEQASTVCYIEPTEELKRKLSPEEYSVLVQAATEPPFANAFWDNHKAGIYIDKIDGTPLFASSTKFESGSGWPSFWNPIDSSALVLVEDKTFGMTRIEVRAKKSGGHLGHLFEDGPKPSGLRYCINSASLEFVPEAEMAARGYGEYLALVRK